MPVAALQIPADATYNVVRAQDGALVVIGVDLDTAYAEAARLSAEAKVQTGWTAPIRDEHGSTVRGPSPIYAGMYHGKITGYEVQTPDRLSVTTSQSVVSEVASRANRVSA